MLLKTFMAKDVREALELVRAELGENAVIVSNQKVKDGVILRAAVEETSATASGTDNNDRDMETGEQSAVHADSPGVESFETKYRQSLVTRLRQVPRAKEKREMVTLSRAGMMAVLRAHRAPDHLCAALAQDAEQSGLPDPALSLARALDKRMKTESVDSHSATAILLAGPYASGKTSVAAKLSAEARTSGRNVMLIATDVSGAGALDRLKTFAGHLDVPLHVANSAREMGVLLQKAREEDVLAIADSAGFDPRDESSWKHFLDHAEAGADILGVVSASTDAEEAAELARALARLGAEGLVITHLDAARRKGALIALACSGIPIAGAARSPFLADGIEPLTPLGLAREILKTAPSLMQMGKVA